MQNALVFPGQGSQYIGMGKSIYNAFPEAKEVFQEVDDALGQHLSELIFNGEIEELTLTHNTQPALMATSIAVLKVIEKQGGKEISELAKYVAGHSLGEYTALCAAGSISIADTAKLLRIRGNAMQKAVPEGKGAMAAIIGLSIEDAEEVARSAANKSEICQVANDNSEGQVVISGSKEAVVKGEIIAKEKGAKRYVLLNVSAPFHCDLMEPAADKMADALIGAEIKVPVVPLIVNVMANETSSPDEIRKYLVSQVTGRVRWRESVIKMHEFGVENLIEVGAGKVLSGLARRIVRDLSAVSIETPEQIEEFLK